MCIPSLGIQLGVYFPSSPPLAHVPSSAELLRWDHVNPPQDFLTPHGESTWLMEHSHDINVFDHAMRLTLNPNLVILGPTWGPLLPPPTPALR